MTAAIVPARDLARLTDVQLMETCYQDHEVAVRDELVRRFMPFARKLATRYLHSREPLDDLVQVANLGLLHAIDRFEPARGRSFTAYAAPTILGELKRHSPDKSWSLHFPREVKERARSLPAGAENGYTASWVAARPWTSSPARSGARSRKPSRRSMLPRTITRNPSTFRAR